MSFHYVINVGGVQIFIVKFSNSLFDTLLKITPHSLSTLLFATFTRNHWKTLKLALWKNINNFQDISTVEVDNHIGLPLNGYNLTEGIVYLVYQQLDDFY